MVEVDGDTTMEGEEEEEDIKWPHGGQLIFEAYHASNFNEVLVVR